MPIDLVVTWVDYKRMMRILQSSDFTTIGSLPESQIRERFETDDEIVFTLASAAKYAPFIETIYIVAETDDLSFLPKTGRHRHWLESRIKLVRHKDIYGQHSAVLPVANSLSIETMLHMIPGLSEHFIYMNDDFLFVAPVAREDFFVDSAPKLYLSFRSPIDRIAYVTRRQANILLRPETVGWYRPIDNAHKLTSTPLGLFKMYHVPHPLRKSLLTDYLTKNPSLMTQNVAHRLRHPSQYNSQALAYCLEIQQGNRHLHNCQQHLYIKPTKKSLSHIRAELEALGKGSNTRFMCIQSLSMAPDHVRSYIKKKLTQLVA